MRSLLWALLFCGLFPKAVLANGIDPEMTHALADPFAPYGAAGTLVVLDTRDGTWRSNDFGRAQEDFLPASTFKIPHALIALELGVVKPDDSLQWNGIRHDIPSWNRDHALKSAIANSVVWYFQETARRIGPERMAGWLDRFGYGNR